MAQSLRMKVAAVAAAALMLPAVAVAQQVPAMRAGGVSIATVPQYRTDTVQTVTRYGSSLGRARLWEQRGYVSGINLRPLREWPGPGPARYGASEEDLYSMVYARVGGVLVEFSPWVRQSRMNSAGVQDRLEQVRIQWLRRNGFTGGVRTVVNPLAVLAGDAGTHMGTEYQGVNDAPKPRATIKVPAERTKIRRKMLVDANTRWSLPPHAGIELVRSVSTDTARFASAD
ncbi:MAG: hypothetical protein AAGB51_06075 [Planctomycetota bacterium]